MKRRLIALLLSSVMAFATLAGCGAEKNSSAAGDNAKPAETDSKATHKAIPKDKIKVGFLYVGPVGDEGYSYAHDQGRKELETKLGVKTVAVENVPENADCEKTIRDLIDQGCNVIYATSFGHGDWVAKVAKEYPDVYFGHATGYLQADNMSNYMGRIEEPRYLSGIAAGMRTASNKIGYVAAMPTAEVIRGINAFTLGVRSVNPKATVEVKWTNSWYDPSMEKSAALELLNGGCDVMAQHCDTTGPQIAAASKGAYCVGYNASGLSASPKSYLTAPLFHWGVFYCEDVQSIIDGTWKSQSYWKGLDSGIVSLDTLSDNCAPGTAEKVEAAKKKILDGSFNVFAGELKDNKGTVRVPAGSQLSDDDLKTIDWFVDGVIGSVPAASK